MYSEKTCPSVTSSTTNPTCLDPILNPGRRGGKPATNRLSYGVALLVSGFLMYFSHRLFFPKLKFKNLMGDPLFPAK
jgi:hypothetical protein